MLKQLEPSNSYSMCYVHVPDVNSVYKQFCENLKMAFSKVPSKGFPRITRLNNLSEDRRFNRIDPAGNRLLIGQKHVSAEVSEKEQYVTAHSSKFLNGYETAYQLPYAKDAPADAAKVKRFERSSRLSKYSKHGTIDRANSEGSLAMEITAIKLALIEEDKDQPRYQFNEEALDELANSIREIGLLSPIKVRALDNGRYKIIYGNRRYKASMMVGLETIPCIVSTASDETDIYLEQIAENLTREDFSPIEEAEAFHKLMNDDRFRSSTKLIASKLGKPESYIKNKLELLKFSNAVRKLIVSGTQIRKNCLTEDQVMPLKDLPLEFRDTLALTAARDELPVSDVKKIAKLFKDSSISDSTKQKLLLKNGSSLIETWSVYEQNRKEKLAREKEQKEKARLAAEQQAKAQAQQHAAQMAAQNSSMQQTAVQQYAAQSATQHSNLQQTDAQQHAAQASALPYAIQQQAFADTETGVTGAAQAKTSAITESAGNAAYFTATTEAALDKSHYINGLEHALQQASTLLQQLQNGTLSQYEASEQLAVDMLIRLEQLNQLWQAIQQASRT